MVAAMCVVMSSCLKNDDSNYVPPVDPAVEAPILKAFADSMNSNFDAHFITQSDSLHYYGVNKEGTAYELKGFLAPYLYYDIVDQGDMTNDSIPMQDSELGGNVGGTTMVYNTLSDSTLYVSATYEGKLLNGQVFDDSHKTEAFFSPVPQTSTNYGLIIAWQLLLNKVGRGGHIRILTPSYYGYANQAMEGIPVNSPLYFDIYVKGFISNNYGKK